MHYGVKGMKWGVRRTPYQLGHRLKKYTSPERERAKAAAKAYASYAVAMIVPGYAAIHNTMVIASRVRSVKHLTNTLDGTDYTKKEGQYEKIKDLKKKTTDRGVMDDLKKVNPRIGQQKGAVNNCLYCTVAMEMRARGYDVRARKKAQGEVDTIYHDWFDGVEIKHPKVERQPKESRKDYINRSYDKLCDELESYGNGARGYVGIKYEKMNSGHSMYWRVDNGRVTIYDGQSGKTNPDKLFALSDPAYCSYARLDNCKLKDQVTETVVSVKDKKR